MLLVSHNGEHFFPAVALLGQCGPTLWDTGVLGRIDNAGQDGTQVGLQDPEQGCGSRSTHMRGSAQPLGGELTMRAVRHLKLIFARAASV